MWVFKPFGQKEQAGLEGRTIDVGNVKINIRNAIAEGGFSCVYLARDVIHASKQYALKHMICNDQETLELVMKEISVMKSLKGHPNVVTLHANTFLDMGRTKEALLVMEFCEKSLVNVLESRGAGYFEEKQVLCIFRDICNAVFAMHCQSPPIAHRDLKAENVLLGSDGLWKLCDFGSTSTNHKRFERPEEMGIEEDNIRKHTTPAYRAPEMWDLFRRELINEKVDIWALGCLLFRICYFKNAFDGESKLQILNGNYRIPEMPKYSTLVTDLIKDMLQASPEGRPDITQVWFRVNELLPPGLKKSLPDRPPEMQSADTREGLLRPSSKTSPMPRRTPPAPPSEVSTRNSHPSVTSRAGGDGGQLGAFWSTQHAKDTVVNEKSGPKFDEPPSHGMSKQDNTLSKKPSPAKVDNRETHGTRKSVHEKSSLRPTDSQSADFEIKFPNSKQTDQKPKASASDGVATFKDQTFNTFVAEFDTSKFSSGLNNNSGNDGASEAEVERLRNELKQANLEKAEITSKFEKLSAICRSQRQEIQELKQALAARTPSPSKNTSKVQTSPGSWSSATTPPREKSEGTTSEQGKNFQRPMPEPQPWQAFADDPKLQQPVSKESAPKSVRTRNGNQSQQSTSATSNFDSWGFGAESFTAVPTSSTQSSKPMGERGNTQRFGDSKPKIENKTASQPAGWAGF